MAGTTNDRNIDDRSQSVSLAATITDTMWQYQLECAVFRNVGTIDNRCRRRFRHSLCLSLSEPASQPTKEIRLGNLVNLSDSERERQTSRSRCPSRQVNVKRYEMMIELCRVMAETTSNRSSSSSGSVTESHSELYEKNGK